MRLGIFGGSFNPVHHGHLLLAQQAAEAIHLDRVLFVPTSESPFKPEDVEQVSGEHRAEMIRLAIEGDDRFELCTLELDRGGVSYTVDTVRHLSAEHPDDALFLLVGSDSLSGFPGWRCPGEILDRATLAWYPRAGGSGLDWADLAASLGEAAVNRIRAGELPGPRTEISATEIRSRVSRNLSIRYWAPDPVCRYIQAHHLYGNPV